MCCDAMVSIANRTLESFLGPRFFRGCTPSVPSSSSSLSLAKAVAKAVSKGKAPSVAVAVSKGTAVTTLPAPRGTATTLLAPGTIGSGGAPVVNFSLKSIVRFQEDNALHREVRAPQPKSLRSRPNYDGRKRKFFMIQPAERRQQPGFSGWFVNIVLRILRILRFYDSSCGPLLLSHLNKIRRPAGVFCGLFWLVLLVLVSIYGLYLRADFSTA